MNQPWIEAFKITPEALGKLHAHASPDLSLLHTSLLEGILPEDAYLDWAMRTYGLPSIKPEFQAQSISTDVLEPIMPLFKWREDLFPVGLWGNTLYVFCHEPTNLTFEGASVQFVLAPAGLMKAAWTYIRQQTPSVSQSEVEAQIQEQVPETASPETIPDTLSADSAPEPEGLAISEEPLESAPPEGFAALEADTPSAPEGLAGLADVGSSPESPAEAETEPPEAPEGIFGSSAATSPNISFASLVNPVASAEPPVQEQVNPIPPVQEKTAQPASTSEVPLIDFNGLLNGNDEETSVPVAAKPAAPKVSSDLAALKVKPEDAASLPPLPQPFASGQTPFPEPDEVPAKSAPPASLKTEWTLAEVSKVTLLKQDPQTVSRTLEFSHLTSSGGAELQVCRAVSHEQIAQASDDVRKSANLEELALNTFKIMKTYFPNSIFLVFLSSSLIPWRWTQSWSRSADTPPGPVDLSTPSIFKIAFQTGLPYHGYVVPSPVNDAFFKEWNGGVLPDHVTLMPVKVGNLIAGMIMGRAERTNLDYKYSLKFMESLSLNISQTLQDLSVKSAS